MSPLSLALGAMFVHQTCTTLGRATLPVIAPAVISDLGLEPSLVGVFVGVAACAGIVTTLGCASFILRHGAVRIAQIGVCVLGVALAGCATGSLPAFAAAALLVGMASALSTPASSHLLARYATPRQAPLIFSIKQTGVPLGLVGAGLLVPLLDDRVGWRWTMIALAVLCVGMGLLLQPLRGRFDADRRPSHPFALRDVRDTLLIVLQNSRLRVLACASFSFVGLQSVFTSYLVLFLTDGHGYRHATAGLVFSIAVGAAIPARIAWGWVAGRTSPRVLLGQFGIVMGLAAVALILVGPHWPPAAIVGLAIVLSVTALSWHGVLLAEVAGIAADGRVGATTGGVLSFGDAAALVMPLAFSATLEVNGSYGLGFCLAGLPALGVGAYLLLADGPKQQE